MGVVKTIASPAHLGVRGKLLAPMLACVAAILGAAVYTAIDGRRERIEEAKDSALVQARLMASSLAIGDLARDVRSVLAFVAATREVRSLDAGGVRDLLERLLDSQGGNSTPSRSPGPTAASSRPRPSRRAPWSWRTAPGSRR